MQDGLGWFGSLATPYLSGLLPWKTVRHTLYVRGTTAHPAYRARQIAFYFQRNACFTQAYWVLYGQASRAISMG